MNDAPKSGMTIIDYILLGVVILLAMIAGIRAIYMNVNVSTPTTASQATPAIQGAPITDATEKPHAH